MRNKRMQLLCLLIGCILLLSSCTTGALPLTTMEPDATIPPAEVTAIAPIGDSGLTQSREMTLYLPCHDGINISSVHTNVAFSPVKPDAESLMRALLGYKGDGIVSQLGGSVHLSLFGINPVEVSRDTVTVNLSASALQLSREAYYIVCQCIANTLTELDEIHYVNVLVADKAIGLDLANTQPMGTLSTTTATEIASQYEQLLSRRGENGTRPFSSNVTLYFPLKGLEAVVSEVHSVTFSSQDFSSMVLTILREMESGPDNAIDSPVQPLLSDFLNEPPLLVESATAGGDIIRLDFAHNYEDMLSTYGLSRSESLAALCYTLCTFFPNVSGIAVLINGHPVTALSESSTDAAEPELRSTFSEFLYDYANLYLGDEDQLPIMISRPVPYSQTGNPRSLLYQLSLGSVPYDSLHELHPVTKSIIQDSMILGTALDGDQYLVNLSPAFQSLLDECETEVEARLMAYAIVNTLCDSGRTKAVTFFMSGRQIESPICGISWKGCFFPYLQQDE